ncbi:non-SMC mitotic condensation complex subunit 1 domain-containing protein [Phthorimaea operculella]|nr:non-SMC mitotic condensation complex subunit 1 domain-containing protein [Phthorimaea operculella]
MALKKVKGNFERMFDKNLTDLVRGIRNNKDNEAKYIAQCMEEIKVELRQDNIAVKANAVAKLTYLQMLGYDISWAIFNIIEVMSSNKFTYKRIGYLAASQSFHADSELLMLTTNMIRKDLNAQNQYEAGLALSGLSCFISTDLARDLANDIMTLMSSTKPYLRMKAVLMMYKVFLRYPDALRPAFPKLKEKLEDPDPGVQSAAVNVVCELARKNPKNYLSLAPVFFKLMTTSTNNWMLIKIIKLFGALTPLEPRLGKKLIEPLTNLIHSTSAMSLLYECINTVIAVLISISSGMPGHAASVQLCVQKLRILIEDSDQNLKYLGLLAMSRILKSHPKSVQAHKDLVLACLDDKDESIRLRALGLLYGMVSKKNLMEIVKKLMVHMERAEGTLYRDELVARCVELCAQQNYHHVTDFEWYVTVLAELTEMETSAKHGTILAGQLTEVGARVADVRAFAARECASIVARAAAQPPGPATREVLYAAAYVLGEYCKEESVMRDAISPLMMCAGVGGGYMRARAVCVHAALKLASKLLLEYEQRGDMDAALSVIRETLAGMRPLLCSEDMEVQERAHNATALLALVLRRLNPNDAALVSATQPQNDTQLIEHEQRILPALVHSGCFVKDDVEFSTSPEYLSTGQPYSGGDSEDMEVQERAHNATALLALVLRRLNPNDAALVSATQPQNDTQLIEHEQSGGDSEDMEVQERAHNATALLALVLRRLNPNDAALVSATQPQNDTQLIEHEQSAGDSEDMEVQERAHNATTLLALVLRRLNPNDAALVSATQPQGDTQLIEHEQSRGNSEDMEVQERAHNATALLSLVLRRLNPNDAALVSATQPQDDTQLIEHEQRY